MKEADEGLNMVFVFAINDEGEKKVFFPNRMSFAWFWVHFGGWPFYERAWLAFMVYSWFAAHLQAEDLEPKNLTMSSTNLFVKIH